MLEKSSPDLRTLERSALPEASADDFRHLMRYMAGTVTIISTECGNQWHGMAATSVISLTMDPPALLFCVNRAASIYAPLLKRNAACLNLLSHEHSDLCSIFSGKEKGEARFNYGQWEAGFDDLPCLQNPLGRIFVRTREEFTYGTHSVFSGAVEKVQLGTDDQPLIYLNGRFVVALAE